MFLLNRHRLHHPKLRTAWLATALISAALLALPGHAGDTSAAQQLSHWSAQAGRAGNAEQGAAFFSARHGGEWSCAPCHGTTPTTQGQHASTGKKIAPLAPAVNPKAYTDEDTVDKWFRRNCKDVLSRECTAAEKADVLAWLVQLKP